MASKQIPNHFHLAGIGGVGMSALAQALLDQGFNVSGSDRLLDSGDETDVLQRLRRQGVRLFPQDGGGVGEASRLIVSSAVEQDNPDVRAALERNIPVVHRAEQLAELTRGHRLMAVAGTCGKSTVAAMAGWILQEAGLDPVVINGAEITGWMTGGRIGSVRKGRGTWCVVEVDESDKSLTVFKPEVAVITNASADHFAMEETLALFDAFRRNVTGTVIDGINDMEGEQILMEGEAPTSRTMEKDMEGEAPTSRTTRMEGECPHETGWGTSFYWRGVHFEIPMPGIHNAHNAWHAARLATHAGVEPGVSAAALKNFPGVARRLQRHGFCNRAVVVDDYAHNPEKIAAAWQAVSACHAPVAAVWRPHGFGPLRKMLPALAEMFARVMSPRDVLFLLPVYDAGGTADRSVNSETLAAALVARGVACHKVATLDAAEAALRVASHGAGALLILGARDPGLPRLAESLSNKI